MSRVVVVGVAFAAMVACVDPSHADARQPTGSIHGRVIDAVSHEPVVSVNVVLVGAGYRGTTDKTGRFSLDNVSVGEFSIRASRIGYVPKTIEGVRIGADTPGEIEILLEREIVPLEEITVTPGAFSFMDDASARQTMSREDIESVPQLGEDVFRAVNRLPGLSSGDYSAHFSIRGGRHDETLILLDGLELYEPYHLKDFNEGAISIVDTETIDGVELMTGGFPARFGNKRSGVFNISSRNPRLDHARYSVGASFMNARALAMGPWADGRGSWIVSARSGYMDLVFKLINQNDLPSPRYQDAFAKVQLDLNADHTLSFDVLHAGDRYTFDAPATTGFLDTLRTREKANNTYGNSYAWATLRSLLGDRTTVRTLVSASLVTRDRDGYEKYVDSTDPLYTVTNHRDFSILGAKQDWAVTAAEWYVLGWGVDVRRFRTTDTLHSEVGRDPNDPEQDADGLYPLLTDASFDATGTRFGVYLSNRFRWVDPLVVELGGRYDRASYTGDRDFSPRASAALAIGTGRTLRAAWGHYRQIQRLDEVTTLDANRSFFPSELSEQWTIGIEQAFEDGALLRIEGYLKEGSHLRPAYRNWKQSPDVFPESNEDRILVFPERTTAKGIEVYYNRQLNDRISVRASYALSVTEEEVSRIDNVNGPDPVQFDRKHPSPQDQRHAANVDCTYHVGRAWTLNGSLSMHTGWPGTHEGLVTVIDDQGDANTAVRPQKIYGARLPSYQRLDVRATRRWSTGRGDFRFFAELVNLTNHANVFGYDYFRERDASGGIRLVRDEEQWFTILPSVGVSFTGRF